MRCEKSHSAAWVRARKWIKKRAREIAKETIKEYGKEKGERVAYALATEQAHKLGITPPSYGNPVSKRLAKRKYKKAPSEYEKQASAESLLSYKRLLGSELKAFRQALRAKARAPHYGNRVGVVVKPTSPLTDEVDILSRFGGKP